VPPLHPLAHTPAVYLSHLATTITVTTFVSKNFVKPKTPKHTEAIAHKCEEATEAGRSLFTMAGTFNGHEDMTARSTRGGRRGGGKVSNRVHASAELGGAAEYVPACGVVKETHFDEKVIIGRAAAAQCPCHMSAS
jgi:hypothetical protein